MIVNSGPIIYIDDDHDDQEMVRVAISSLLIPNELRLFSDGEEALHYFQTTAEKPLLILCDINMPLMNGIELRRCINENEYLKKKATPFLFYTTEVNPAVVDLAYENTVQGFYKKAITYGGIKDQIRSMIEYWERCFHPNSQL